MLVHVGPMYCVNYQYRYENVEFGLLQFLKIGVCLHFERKRIHVAPFICNVLSYWTIINEMRALRYTDFLV